MYGMFGHGLPEDVLQDIIRGAAEVESLFIDEALSCDVVGINNDRMVEYIEFVADQLILVLLLLGISMHVLLQAHWECRLPSGWALLRPT